MSDLQKTENPVREGTVSQKSNSRPKSVKSSKKSAASKKSNSELKEPIKNEDNQENAYQNGDENDELLENPDESFHEPTPDPETPEPVEEPLVTISHKQFKTVRL